MNKNIKTYGFYKHHEKAISPTDSTKTNFDFNAQKIEKWQKKISDFVFELALVA